jgi:tRNA (mo5U34)-methyltransferase
MESAREFATSEKTIISETVKELSPWFHNYEIAAGVWTNPSGQFPGIEYPLQRWRLIQPLLPEVRGKSCLDVGCSSGFFSLKLKELGAAYVLGVDSGEQPKAIEQAQFAARTLALEVDFRVMSAYDLGTLGQKFDLILFMGLFYHLRHPLVALEALRAVCSGTLLFQSITTHHKNGLRDLNSPYSGDVDLLSPILNNDEFPSLRFVEGTLNGDVSCWFIPNMPAVAAILRSSGFELDQVTFTNDYDVIVRCKIPEAQIGELGGPAESCST